MKIRLTIMTENDVPVKALGENGLEKVRIAWETVLALLTLRAGTNESIRLEKVELVEDGHEPLGRSAISCVEGGADG